MKYNWEENSNYGRNKKSNNIETTPTPHVKSTKVMDLESNFSN